MPRNPVPKNKAEDSIYVSRAKRAVTKADRVIQDIIKLKHAIEAGEKVQIDSKIIARKVSDAMTPLAWLYMRYSLWGVASEQSIIHQRIIGDPFLAWPILSIDSIFDFSTTTLDSIVHRGTGTEKAKEIKEEIESIANILSMSHDPLAAYAKMFKRELFNNTDAIIRIGDRDTLRFYLDNLVKFMCKMSTSVDRSIGTIKLRIGQIKQGKLTPAHRKFKKQVKREMIGVSKNKIMLKKFYHTMAAFEFVNWFKHKKRLQKIIIDRFKDPGAHMEPDHKLDIKAWELMGLGIPARQIVGPYTYLKPAAVIKQSLEAYREVDAQYQCHNTYICSAALPASNLISEVNRQRGTSLDFRDRELRDKIFTWTTTHDNKTPSMQQVINFNRELEKQRETANREESMEILDFWLKWSERYVKKHANKGINPPEGFIYATNTKEIKEELFKRTTSWGMCLIDQMDSWLGEQVGDREVFALVMATNRKRGTICGLTKRWVCEYSYYCTGVNNKADDEAFDYFSTERWWEL